MVFFFFFFEKFPWLLYFIKFFERTFGQGSRFFFLNILQPLVNGNVPFAKHERFLGSS